VHLLSLVDHDTGTTLVQREIGAKPNDIPGHSPARQVDLEGKILTLNALHTRRATAQAIVTYYKAAYLLAIKGDQSSLRTSVALRFTRLNAFYQERDAFHVETSRGDGRMESRQIRVAGAHGIDFPHAARILPDHPPQQEARRACLASSGSPHSPPPKQDPATWQDTPADTGRWKTRATTCVT
jgi:predicted transposase YbfD/YdcC